ncbi:MAG: hypothetical protein WD688_20960 [Candidatus Binatia bacterium]
MPDQPELKINEKRPAISSNEAVAVGEPEVPQAKKQTALKGMLMMALCCAAPFLLLTAIPFLAVTFGSFAAMGAGVLSIVALLACPVGMYLMMRMMMKHNK